MIANYMKTFALFEAKVFYHFYCFIGFIYIYKITVWNLAFNN